MLASVVIFGCGLDNGPADSISMDVGEAVEVTVATHCGFETLEININGSSWSTDELEEDEAGNLVEPAWPVADDVVRLELELVDGETLLASVPGTEVVHTYRPDSNPPPCL